jgi:hypothetical protein
MFITTSFQLLVLIEKKQIIKFFFLLLLKIKIDIQIIKLISFIIINFFIMMRIDRIFS